MEGSNKKTIGPESRRRQVSPAGPGLSDSEPIAECCALPWPYFFLAAFFLVTFLATFFLATFFLTFLIAGLHPQVLHIILPFLQFTRFSVHPMAGRICHPPWMRRIIT